MITESKFLQLESLQELIKVIRVYIIIVINTMSWTSLELAGVIIDDCQTNNKRANLLCSRL